MAQHDSRGLREKIISVETDYGGLSSADGSILLLEKVGPGAGGQRGLFDSRLPRSNHNAMEQSVDRTDPPRGMIGNLAPVGWDRGCFCN
ncbi:hypothetical protein BO85DRAFT_451918 [Aspergillus piperis CBS 112811]|uniref:Uncharacterized protein n=1 Tax=Aspergillus piperis CBS 112811 TaxID=1448313 RepID=A0A8G1QW85_9EURO|nr:hypothetical protein BO85DRAFT_451918 [Aspergillus piperis CBS 112811]RAH55018.1 hypothetical protein BO85DRAFT_451918 [Aspergillus piperis CBS 112811]